MRRYTAPPPLLQLSPPRQAAGCARAALFVKTPVVEVQERGQRGGREAFKKEGGGSQGREMAFQKQEGHAEGRCGIRRQGFYAQRVRLSAESSAKTAPPDSASLPCGPPREQAVWSMDDAGESSWCSDKCASHIVEDTPEWVLSAGHGGRGAGAGVTLCRPIRTLSSWTAVAKGGGAGQGRGKGAALTRKLVSCATSSVLLRCSAPPSKSCQPLRATLVCENNNDKRTTRFGGGGGASPPAVCRRPLFF